MKNLILVLAFLAFGATAEPSAPAGQNKPSINTEVSIAPAASQSEYTPIDVKDVSDDLNSKLKLTFDEVVPAPKLNGPLLVSIN
ncbi:MAG: hypothetical protein V7742_03145 [Halioglobus sp.]